MDQPQHQDQRQPNDILPLAMEILVADSRQDPESNESVCSLCSLVSGDNDSLLLEDSLYDVDDCDSDTTPTLPHQHSSSSPVRHHRFSSHPSISTEMAIIASSSPEIKALSSRSITPSFPKGLNFDFYQQENDPVVETPKARTTFVLPLPATNTDHIHDKNSEQARKPITRDGAFVSNDVSSSTLHPPETRTDEADELALFMERQSLVRDVASPPTAIGEYKENFSPPFSVERTTPETSNRSYDGSAVPVRSALRKETKQHHSLSSMVSSNKRRQSFHRRVSFTSLPSPAEIATLRAQSPTPVDTLHSQAILNNVAAPAGKSPLAMDFPFF
jgi:hypothetical protein